MNNSYFRTGLFGVSLLLLLTGCTPTEPALDTTASGAKSPFIIETLQFGTTKPAQEVKKAGRIVASSSLTITAQSAGEVAKISVKEGQSVKGGTTLLAIKDTLTNLDIRLSQAENALEVQSATRDTTKANLDISIENARIALERAKQAYDTLNSKNALQFDTIVNANQKTLETYNGSYASYLADLDRNITQLLFEGDKILGISPDFDSATDSWDPYLGVRIGDSRTLAVNAWNNVYATRGLVRAKIEKGAKFDPMTATGDLQLLSDSFTSLRKYVDAMIYMLQNNVVGGGLSQVQQDGWMVAWNGYRAQVQGSDSGFNAWKAQIGNFLKSYANTETATNLAVANLSRALTPAELAIIEGNSDLKLTFETTKIDLDDRVKTAKLSVEQAETGYKNAKILRDATLKQLAASYRSSELSLEQAKRDYSKLRPSSPVDGVVTKVFASFGQSINVGTPLVEIVGRQPEILLDIDADLANNIVTGDNVSVEVEDKVFTGVITAISRAAGANLLYTTRISVPDAGKYIGSAVSITFTSDGTVASDAPLTLPLKSVKIISEQEGEIVILRAGNKIEYKDVRLGKIIGDSVIIEDTLDTSTEIILSDISNFDPEKNFLKKEELK